MQQTIKLAFNASFSNRCSDTRFQLKSYVQTTPELKAFLWLCDLSDYGRIADSIYNLTISGVCDCVYARARKYNTPCAR